MKLNYGPLGRPKWDNASDLVVRELGFPLIAFSQSHAGTPTVLVDELDTGRFERPPNHRERGVTRFRCLALE
jgi:hypothetical protein